MVLEQQQIDEYMSAVNTLNTVKVVELSRQYDIQENRVAEIVESINTMMCDYLRAKHDIMRDAQRMLEDLTNGR